MSLTNLMEFKKEVHYDDGNVVSWTEDEILSADSPDDLIADVEMMLSDIKKYKDDILDYEA